MSSARHAAPAGNTTQLFVRSNIHMANLDKAVKKYLHLQKFVDVTLSCEGRKFKCHRLILAASSPLFENLFFDNPAQHPIVIIPFGIKAWTLQALIEFMYKGHVNVSQCGLQDLVRSAELLRITGLENARKDYSMYCYDSSSNNNNSQNSNGHSSSWAYLDSGMDTETAAVNTTRLSPPAPVMYGYDDVELDEDEKENQDEEDGEDDDNNNNNVADAVDHDVEYDGHNVDDIVDSTAVDADRNHSEPLEMAHMATTNGESSKYQANAQSRDPSDFGDEDADDEIDEDDVANIIQDMRLNNIKISNKVQRKPIGKIRVKSSEMLLKHNDEGSTVSASGGGGIVITGIQSVKREADEQEEEEEDQVELGVESIICHPNVSYICPSSPNGISQYNNGINPAFEFSNDFTDINVQSILKKADNDDEEDDGEVAAIINSDAIRSALQTSLRPKQKKGTTYESSKDDYIFLAAAAAVNTTNNCESTTTSPTQTSLSKATVTGTAFHNTHEIMVATEKLRPVALKLAYEVQQQQDLQHEQQQFKVKAYKKQFYEHFRRQLQSSNNSNIATIAAAEAKLKPKQFHMNKLLAPMPRCPASKISANSLTTTFKSATIMPQQLQQQHQQQQQQHVGIVVMSEPSVDTVVLRSPRSNQPRNYSTQALYNALMAVKHGESIYRASREHHVPRKTLRNWMKRWNIKSQFPMPKQLKDAAIRKKIKDNIKLHNY